MPRLSAARDVSTRPSTEAKGREFCAAGGVRAKPLPRSGPRNLRTASGKQTMRDFMRAQQRHPRRSLRNSKPAYSRDVRARVDTGLRAQGGRLRDKNARVGGLANRSVFLERDKMSADDSCGILDESMSGRSSANRSEKSTPSLDGEAMKNLFVASDSDTASYSTRDSRVNENQFMNVVNNATALPDLVDTHHTERNDANELAPNNDNETQSFVNIHNVEHNTTTSSPKIVRAVSVFHKNLENSHHESSLERRPKLFRRASAPAAVASSRPRRRPRPHELTSYHDFAEERKGDLSTSQERLERFRRVARQSDHSALKLAEEPAKPHRNQGMSPTDRRLSRRMSIGADLLVNSPILLRSPMDGHLNAFEDRKTERLVHGMPIGEAGTTHETEKVCVCFVACVLSKKKAHLFALSKSSSLLHFVEKSPFYIFEVHLE